MNYILKYENFLQNIKTTNRKIEKNRRIYD